MKHRLRQNQVRYQCFCDVFRNENILIDRTSFTKMLGDLRLKFRKWNSRLIGQPEQYVQTFIIGNWGKLQAEKRSEHRLDNCSDCLGQFSDVQSLFPVASNRFISTQRNADLADLDKNPSLKCTKRKAKQEEL